MLVFDAAWCVVLSRLIKRKRWRVLAGLFMAAQMIILLWLLCDLDWRVYPQAIHVAVVIWHRIALPLAIGVLVLFGIVKWLGRVTKGSRKPAATASGSANTPTRREFIGACVALAPHVFTVGSTAVALAQLNQFRVRRFTLSIPTLPRALDGMTIAHLSDMHVGAWTYGRVLRKIVERTNALRPDVVLHTGDLIDYDLADLSEAIAVVNAMEGRYGQWMVEGNHDLFDDGCEFARRVKAAGVPLLIDESAIANIRGHPVQLFGLRWMGFGKGIADDRLRDRLTAAQMRLMMKRRELDAFPILLAHHPHAFDAAAKADLPLTVAGHTHGGQWMLDRQRGVGPVLFRYWSGLYTRGRSQMIVSNGVGNVFPIRINAPAEIIHITLHCG